MQVFILLTPKRLNDTVISIFFLVKSQFMSRYKLHG